MDDKDIFFWLIKDNEDELMTLSINDLDYWFKDHFKDDWLNWSVEFDIIDWLEGFNRSLYEYVLILLYCTENVLNEPVIMFNDTYRIYIADKPSVYHYQELFIEFD